MKKGRGKEGERKGKRWTEKSERNPPPLRNKFLVTPVVQFVVIFHANMPVPQHAACTRQLGLPPNALAIAWLEADWSSTS